MSKKLPSIKSLEKKAWDLCREYIYERDKSQCQKCGRFVTGKSRQPSHVIPKSRSKLLRYDYRNVKTLCGGCHIWWHGFPTLSGDWFREKFPKRAEYTDKNAHTSLKEILSKKGVTQREWLNNWIKWYETRHNTTT